jgi:hypothetical protein
MMAITTPVPTNDAGNLNADGILDILNEPDDKIELEPEKPPKKEVKDGKEEEKPKEEKVEEDELEELERELEEPDDKELEFVSPVRRQEILKKYPQLFKDFPYLEKAYYREQQYTEIFPSLEDARVAVEKSSTLDKFQEELMGGSVEGILKAVKETDANSFYKIADNYLPTLARVDERAYYNILGNVVKNTITTMFREGERINNDTLKQAATIVNQFVFGTSEYTPPVQMSQGQNPQLNQQEQLLKQQQQQFVQQRFESVRDDLSSRVDKTLQSTIDAYIDPKESMSPYVRRNASREAVENLQSLLDGDTRLRSLLDKMWERAFQSNFSRDSLDRIRETYLSRAKALLPAVIKRARNEAMKGMGHRIVDNGNEPEIESTKERRPRTANSSSPGNKKEIPKGMSTLEFFNQE